MLLDTFTRLCREFTNDARLIERHWHNISKNYSGRKRHYHNLDHLSNMFAQLESCRHLIADWDSALFALFYHDLVYTTTSNDNEEKSAVEAGKKLKELNVPAGKITRVNELILATRSHKASDHNDINLFTDADLSILGSSEPEYEQYCANVRKEYSIFPDVLYKPGRRKVLQHFLDMPYIFKTEFFRSKMESAARRNIENELKTLQT
jgi:predicted metal-dependent HD superfamily phosphohydrolase